MLLPFDERVQLDERDRQLFTTVEKWVDDRRNEAGYVAIDTDRGLSVVFFRAGRTYCAGELIDGHFAARTITDFMRHVPYAKSASYYAVSLPLFFCTAVLFRKAPTTSIEIDALGAQAVLDVLDQETRDAVVAIRSRSFFTLILCRSGQIQSTFSADPSFPSEGSDRERTLAYVEQSAAAGPVVADLYTDIRLPPASDAGLAVAPLDEEEARSADLALLISLSGRPVFYFSMSDAVVHVGRGPENDLALDSVSVSRRHARFVRDGARLVVEDLGGENGVLFNGERVTKAVLNPGDTIVIGTYSIFYSPTHDVASVAKSAAPKPSSNVSMEATMAISGRARRACIAHEGKKHRINVPVFLIGTSVHAHLRIDGFLIRPVHVELQRAPGGHHRITRVGNWRRLFVAGRSVKQADLENGLRFTIGSHEFQYLLDDERSSTPSIDVLESAAQHA